jgi:hypothetical protein
VLDRFHVVRWFAASLVAVRRHIQRREPHGQVTPASAEPDDSGSDEESEEPAAEAMDLQIESGFTSGTDSIGTRYTSAGALVTNPNATLAAYEVSVVFNLLDGSGAILDTDAANVPYIPAGATVPVAPLQIGFEIAADAASIDVNIAGTFEEDTGWDGAGFIMGDGIDLDVSGAAVTQGDFGPSVDFTVTNPSDTVAELGAWDCVFKAGGAIVGGETSTIVDPVVPGGQVRVDSTVLVDLTADEVICRAYA